MGLVRNLGNPFFITHETAKSNDQPSLHWELINQLFTVERIMTSDLLTWSKDTSIEVVKENAKKIKADNIPVIKDGRLVEILRINCNDLCENFSEDWSIADGTTISDALAFFVERNKPAFFVSRYGHIVGIVTPSDFNKLPARNYFYNLLAAFEMQLAKRITDHFDRLYFENADNEIEKYTVAVKKAKKRMEKHDLKIRIINAFDLNDLLQIVINKEDLKQEFNTQISLLSQEKRDQLRKFRNNVMHTNNLILNDQQGVTELNDNVQFLSKLLSLKT